MIKIAQLIDKCNFHGFCRPLCNSKNYEICFSTLICHEEAYIKFWGHLEQVHFGLISKLIQRWIKANPKCWVMVWSCFGYVLWPVGFQDQFGQVT